MSFRVAGKPSRWSRQRPAIVIVAALSLFAAALGCSALQISADASAPPCVSVSVFDAGPVHHKDGSALACHSDFGSTLNDDKAFKSAGLKRDRPPTFPLTVPRSLWSTPAVAGGARWQQWGHPSTRAPVTTVAGQGLLTQLCVARC
ncbi:hypothetical protein OQ968_22340 [Mycobacterium sp. 663a-19]|uniref:hypothetical protein n=1 Tax=Mycobacterium sp. 663a-19 TaxID=2986148 RepID=UPI002D1F027B|nr:hypothetical protein [Mycobacterium sp. 663a-19]MEB3983992.1 hypothetical protein [Mycobacterium sp. 663a-19]